MSILNALKSPSVPTMELAGAQCNNTITHTAILPVPFSVVKELLGVLAEGFASLSPISSPHPYSYDQIHCQEQGPQITCQGERNTHPFRIAPEALDSFKHWIESSASTWNTERYSGCSLTDRAGDTLSLTTDHSTNDPRFSLKTGSAQTPLLFTTEPDVHKRTFRIFTQDEKADLFEFLKRNEIDCHLPNKLALCEDANEVQKAHRIAIVVMLPLLLMFPWRE